MSKDTIYRQAAVDLVTDMEFMNDTAKGILRDRLRKLPSAQPEDYAHGFADGYIQGKKDAQPEIIRCKYCKFYETWQLKSDYTDDKRCKTSVCVRGRYAIHRSEDWYCADAKRRTDEIN